jgi:putative FmdB family regulatory protein
MPTYEYACKSCSERLEVQQRFTDDPLTECPSCGGPLRKVFGNVGIAFKGSGFYKTDSRGSSSSTSSSSTATTTDSSSSSGTTESSSGTSESSSSTAAPSTPAPAAS